MKQYIETFSGKEYAESQSVESHIVLSQNPAARELETKLKSGLAFSMRDMPQMLQLMQLLPAGEKNYIAACFIAWIPAHVFDALSAAGQLPAEVCIAQEAEDRRFGDSYYLFKWSALQWRTACLSEWLDMHTNKVESLKCELANLEAMKTAQGPALATASCDD